MFTGIITDIGTILSRNMTGSLTIRIGCNYDSNHIEIGESIACNGVCLTVTNKGESDGRHWFEAQVSPETLRVTTSDGWQEKSRINLERALKMGDSLSGHMVTGHVDDVATVLSVESDGASHQITLQIPKPLHRFISTKGSITLNGVSLTVNEVNDDIIRLTLIPHTWVNTNFHLLKPHDHVNVEVDTMAKMIIHSVEHFLAEQKNGSTESS